MHILMITRYFPPLDSIASSRMYCWAKYLHQLGCKISILTTSKEGQVVVPVSHDLSAFKIYELPYFDPVIALGGEKKKVYQSNTEKKNGWKQKLYRFYREQLNERIPGRTDTWIFPAIKELKRQKREGESYDAIISSYGPPASHIIALKAKKLFECPWLADFRDPWVDCHFSKGVWPFRFIEQYFERCVCTTADLVTSVSKGCCALFSNKYKSARIEVVRNGFDPDQFEGISSNYFQNEPPCFRLVFTGSLLSGRYNLRPIMQAIHQLVKQGELSVSNFRFLFFGNSVDNLFELVEEYQLKEVVEYRGSVSLKEAYAAQKSADALFFVEKKDPEFDGILSGKIFEYLYVDAPILAIGITPRLESGQLIQEASAGVVCGEDVDKIQRTLLQMVRGEYKIEKNREQIMQHSRKNQAKRVHSLLMEASRGRAITL